MRSTCTSLTERDCCAGSVAYGGSLTLTAALRLVEAALATAMSYLTVVWGLILGYFFFSEVLAA